MTGNVPYHKSAGVRAAVEAAGCRPVFLPPSTPDLDPIELAFAKFKRALQTDGHREVPTLVTFLRAAGVIIRPDERRAYIRHCGCGVHATSSPNTTARGSLPRN